LATSLDVTHGQPYIITGDGQNILVTTNGTVKEIDPTGAPIWNQSIDVSNDGKAIKAGKYVYLGTGNDAKALNKADGSTKWTSLSPLGDAQPIKYVYIKGPTSWFLTMQKPLFSTEKPVTLW
jgi:hypothetical protein